MNDTQLVLSSPSPSLYTISGSIRILLDNKQARMMLRSQLKYEETNGIIIIESDKGIDYIARIVKLVARYIAAEVVFDEKTNEDIKDYKEREYKFDEFSHKAKDVKNNIVDKAEFQDFVDVLDEKMQNRHLYKLQLLSAYHLAFSQNACNFSVPGAGKTSIVYGAYTYLKNKADSDLKHVDKLLIIGPLSSFGPWEKEYEECFGRKATCKRLSGQISLEQKKQYFYGNTAELNLISYPSVVSVKEELTYFLRNNKVMVVLDEAHKIKNTNGGITALTIKDIARWCSSRVVLTGTPAPNGYEDLYNLFHFIWPQTNVIRYNVGQLKDMSKNGTDDERVDKVMENVSPYFIRICKKDLGLPPVTENAPIIVPMKEAQRRIYDFIEQRFVDEVNKDKLTGELHSILVRAKMMRLQQVSTNPAMLRIPLSQFKCEYEDNFESVEAEDSAIMSDIMRFYKDEVPAKYEECLKLIKDIISRGEKVIVWVIFISNIKSFSNYLSEQGIDNRVLYGETPIAFEGMDEEDYSLTREAIVNEFHNPDSAYKVIIANPFAVAESISLHKACHNAIYMERSFNCAHFLQSKDRIHRYGLDKDVKTNYYYLLSQDSVDETIDDRLRIKEKRMLDIIESMPIPLFKNAEADGDMDDIKAILTDYVKRKARATI
jgi:SNF2 family DNA or RNA helicase